MTVTRDSFEQKTQCELVEGFLNEVASNNSWLRYVRRTAPPELFYLFEPSDLLQEACFVAYHRRGSFRGDGEVRSWFLAVMRNRLRSCCRQHAAQIARFKELKSGTAERLRTSREPGPLALCLRDEQLSDLAAALEKLPEKQVEAVHLVCLMGRSVTDAAEELGGSPETLSSRLYRARQSLVGMARWAGSQP